MLETATSKGPVAFATGAERSAIGDDEESIGDEELVVELQDAHEAEIARARERT